MNLSALPRIKGKEAAARWCTSQCGVPTTARYVKQCTEDGSLPSFKIANVLYYSTEDLAQWIASHRRAASEQNATASR